MQTKYVTVAETKRDLSKLLRDLNGQYYLITRHGKPQAVLVSYEEFEKLENKQSSVDEVAKRSLAYQRILARQKTFQKHHVSTEKIHRESRKQLEKRGFNGLLGH